MINNSNAFITWLLGENQLKTLWQSRLIEDGSSWSVPTQLSDNSTGAVTEYDLSITTNGSVKIVWTEPKINNTVLIEATFN